MGENEEEEVRSSLCAHVHIMILSVVLPMVA